MISRGEEGTATRARGARAWPGAASCLAAMPALVTLSVSPPLRAEPQEAPAPWEFTVTPYVWLPHIDTTLNFDTTGSDGSPVAMSDVLKYLTGAFFLNGEARKGRWGLAFDFVYCNFSKASSNVSSVAGPGGVVEVPVNTGTTTTLGGSMVSLTGSYSLLETPTAEVDVLSGIRYTHIGATLHWDFAADVAELPSRSGSTDRSVDLWDGVIGLRGHLGLGASKWFVPYYVDAGTGTAKFTWQAVTGIGYSFGWGDLLLVYRYLSFEQGDAEPVQRLEFAGPALGATFRF